MLKCLAIFRRSKYAWCFNILLYWFQFQSWGCGGAVVVAIALLNHTQGQCYLRPENHTCDAIKQVFRISAHFLEDISRLWCARVINLVPQHTVCACVPLFIADRATQNKKESHTSSLGEMSSCLFFLSLFTRYGVQPERCNSLLREAFNKKPRDKWSMSAR